MLIVVLSADSRWNQLSAESIIFNSSATQYCGDDRDFSVFVKNSINGINHEFRVFELSGVAGSHHSY